MGQAAIEAGAERRVPGDQQDEIFARLGMMSEYYTARRAPLGGCRTRHGVGHANHQDGVDCLIQLLCDNEISPADCVTVMG